MASTGAHKKKGRSHHQKPVKKQQNAGKARAFERPIIPIPAVHEDVVDVEEDDLEFFRENEGVPGFLSGLDHNAISKSKKEIERLHKLSKPAQVLRGDTLPSVESHSDDGASWHASDDDSLSLHSSDSDVLHSPKDMSPSDSERPSPSLDSDVEQPYEVVGRKRRRSWDDDPDQGPSRLPIKLADGQIKRLKNLEGRPIPRLASFDESSSEEESEDEDEMASAEGQHRDDVATGARFGRAAPVDVIALASRKERIQKTKEQLAGICQDIMAEPENSLGLLRRLHTFSLPTITTASHPEPVHNDILIRKLAFLSQLAVFKDVVPGYRIRALTEKEKEEKVSQMVMRTREWEQGLVGVYQSYLRSLEAEIKARSELADVSLRCMCTLLTDLTHFNFRTNLISVIIGRLSRKSWDESSQLCRDTIVSVFRNDLTGLASLEIVRLLNRMIKERKFNVHPNLLTTLLHLRLKSELGGRPTDRKEEPTDGEQRRKAHGKEKVKPHLSKKAKKARKENKEIEKEMEEAEAEVDREERSKTHTETLKLLFVLYFRILKDPRPNRLLPAALAGVSSFAHLINIDFFKDLLEVLKDLINRANEGVQQDAADDAEPKADNVAQLTDSCHLKLFCIVTAFELLSGQGEALNIDLGYFVNQLYAVLTPLAFSLDIEGSSVKGDGAGHAAARPGKESRSNADLLFRALSLLFSRRSAGNNPPWRSAAFAKRLLSSALSWPQATVARSLDFVCGLLATEHTLDALLSPEERKADGVYRPELDDPQLCNPFATSFWELTVLAERHPDAGVRDEARKLTRWSRSSST